MNFDLPPHFLYTVRETFPGGEEWLAQLPQLLAAVAARWSLRIGAPFAELSYNLVLAAEGTDGRSVVLKMGVPNAELRSEIAALQFWNGRATVRLIDGDPDWGVLLLERLRPGTMLSWVPDDEAAQTAALLMQELWQPPPRGHEFVTVAAWAAGLDRLRAEFGSGTGPFAPHLVALAEAIFAALLPSMAAPVLLHGDLHQYNILRGARRPWLIIDPKGVIGERAYEIGAFMRNCLPENGTTGEIKRQQARRLDIFAEVLGLDRERMLQWCLAQQVLSAWWSYEDTGLDYLQSMELAALFAEMGV